MVLVILQLTGLVNEPSLIGLYKSLSCPWIADAVCVTVIIRALNKDIHFLTSFKCGFPPSFISVKLSIFPSPSMLLWSLVRWPPPVVLLYLFKDWFQIAFCGCWAVQQLQHWGSYECGLVPCHPLWRRLIKRHSLPAWHGFEAASEQTCCVICPKF